jgi:hypothetical protein
MRTYRFGPSDWKLLLFLALIFNLPPLLVLVPGVGVLGVLPTVFWANIAGVPLTLLRVHHYDMQEFGVTPKGPVDVGLIVLFWCVAAFVATAIVKYRRQRATTRDQST